MTSKKVTSVVGLDIEAASIAATELDGHNGSARVGRTAISPLEPGIVSEGEVQNPSALAEALKEMFASAKLPKAVRVGLANQRVIVRNIQLPLIEKPEELATAVRFQAQEHFPMPLDQAVLEHHVVSRTAGVEGDRKMDVIAVAARRDMLSILIGALRAAGLRPEGVDLSAFGLIRALQAGVVDVSEDGEETHLRTTLYCHLGDVTNLAIGRGPNCLFTRVSPFGLESVAERLSEAGGIPLEDARERMFEIGLTAAGSTQTSSAGGGAEREALEQASSKLVDEVRLSLEFYAAQDGAASVDEVVVCGPGSQIEGLADRIQLGLGRPVEVRTPAALSEFAADDASRLTVSYGLALEG